MRADSRAEDVVMFEVPDFDTADRLLRRVAPGWLAWLQTGRTRAVTVGVLLHGDDELELARLLRSVQTWADSARVGPLRFDLDGRSYDLGARQGAPVLGSTTNLT